MRAFLASYIAARSALRRHVTMTAYLISQVDVQLHHRNLHLYNCVPIYLVSFLEKLSSRETETFVQNEAPSSVPIPRRTAYP